MTSHSRLALVARKGLGFACLAALGINAAHAAEPVGYTMELCSRVVDELKKELKMPAHFPMGAALKQAIASPTDSADPASYR